ncbi:MAG: hypothetical protein WC581_05395 [Thermodesulfovibrionales bacterium]
MGKVELYLTNIQNPILSGRFSSTNWLTVMEPDANHQFESGIPLND